MVPGVVSVMVTQKVACRSGGFQRIWMSNAANSPPWIRFGQLVDAGGQFGQFV